MSLCVDITKKFGSFTLNAKFQTEDEITALFGFSGSGKSVTLKCIAGIIKPDSGKIIINNKVVFDSDKNINLPAKKRNIGYVPQSYALFPNMTVSENICCGLHNLNRREKRTVVDEYIKRFSLLEIRSLYPHQISGGQQQRVALARALATKPEVLLLDEPFSALDFQIKQQLEIDLLHTLYDFKKSVLFVSHNREEVMHLCNSVCVVNNGNTQDIKSLDEVISSPKTTVEATICSIENISGISANQYTDFGFKVNNSSCGFVGVKSNDIKLNETDCDITFSAKVTEFIRTVNGYKIVLQKDINSKPIIANIFDIQKYTIGEILTVGLNYKDVLYLK